MKILAIETTGKYGSAALIDDAGNVTETGAHDGNDHLRELIATVDRTLSAAGAEKSELTHVAVSVGPGSFTGIRIGVAAARTFGQMMGIPCIAVSSLEAMAHGAAGAADECGADIIVPIINARRHQTYAGTWKPAKGGEIEPLLEESQYMIEELCEALVKECGAERPDARVYFTGDGIDAYEDIISKLMPARSYTLASEAARYQHSGPVAEIALRKAAAGDTLAYDELLPNYMRLAEAEQRLRAGTLSDKISSIKIYKLFQ